MPCIRSSGVRIAGAWPSALIARICIGVIDDSASLAVDHGAVDGVQPVGGVGQLGAHLHHHRADGVAALGGGDVGLLGLEPDRDHRHQALLGQGLLLEQVAPQRARAHRDHHVVDGGAGRLADRAQPLDRPVLGGEPARPGDRLVEHRARGVQRERRGLVADRLVEGADQRAGQAGRLRGDAEGAAQGGDRDVLEPALGLLPLPGGLRAARAARPRAPASRAGPGRWRARSPPAASRSRRRPARGGSWCTSPPGRRAAPR